MGAVRSRGRGDQELWGGGGPASIGPAAPHNTTFLSTGPDTNYGKWVEGWWGKDGVCVYVFGGAAEHLPHCNTPLGKMHCSLYCFACSDV